MLVMEEKIISEKSKKNETIPTISSDMVPEAAFVAAATPIPDDLVYVPLGLAKYNPKRFFIATLTGKLVFIM